MKKIKNISIIIMICILAVSLCSCKKKQNKNNSVEPNQKEILTEEKTETDMDIKHDGDEEVSSGSYNEFFEEDATNDNIKVENNSGTKGEKQENITISSDEKDKEQVEDETSNQPKNERIETVTDTDTQYGAISDGNP